MGSLRRRLLGNDQKGAEGPEDIQEKSVPDTRKTVQSSYGKHAWNIQITTSVANVTLVREAEGKD